MPPQRVPSPGLCRRHPKNLTKAARAMGARGMSARGMAARGVAPAEAARGGSPWVQPRRLESTGARWHGCRPDPYARGPQGAWVQGHAPATTAQQSRATRMTWTRRLGCCQAGRLGCCASPADSRSLASPARRGMPSYSASRGALAGAFTRPCPRGPLPIHHALWSRRIAVGGSCIASAGPCRRRDPVALNRTTGGE